jgi:hypothetical protein
MCGLTVMESPNEGGEDGDTTMTDTPREYAFWPPPDGPLGMLFCVGDDGQKVTRLVDGEWLRTMIVTPHWALADLVIPESSTVPMGKEGWPDEPGWSGAPMLNLIADDLSSGNSWSEVRAALIEAGRR